MRRLLAGTIASMVVSAAGWRASALSGRGAIAATVVGAAIAAGSSWPGMAVLGTFFGTSSILSRGDRGPGIAAKGHRRDERQVLANGAMAAVGALFGSRIDPRLGLGLAAGALSAAAADTWATELGAGSRSVPRLICSGRAAPPGTSGGVTLRGSIGALGGAAAAGAVTALVAAATSGWTTALRLGPAVVVAGVAGSLTDSLLGELAQERRRCPACDLPAEARMHHCGAQTDHVGGVVGVDNDLVNLACTAVGSLFVIPFAMDLIETSGGSPGIGNVR